tara:strand:- start:2025 stop:2630 length:606 start_codon:yes stop_codon:yes gene_type:complete
MRSKFESTFSYQDGKIVLESKEKPIAVDITYKGMIRGVSELPNGFFVAAGNKRIVVINFGNNDMPETILSYLGYFDALKVIVYSKEGVSYSTINKNYHIWNKITNAQGYAKMTSNWEDYNHMGESFPDSTKDSVLLSNTRKSYILNNNLTSDIGNFTLNGEKYEGKIIYDTRGLFMNENKQQLSPKVKPKLLNKIMNKGRR